MYKLHALVAYNFGKNSVAILNKKTLASFLSREKFEVSYVF